MARVVALAALLCILASTVAADRGLLDFRAPCNPTRNACGQHGANSTTTCTKSTAFPPTPICGCKPGYKDYNPTTKMCTPDRGAAPTPTPGPGPVPSPLPTPLPAVPAFNACTNNPCGSDPKYVCITNRLSLKAECRCAAGYLGPYPACVPNPLPDPCNPNPCPAGPAYSCFVSNAILNEFQCQCAKGYLGFFPDCVVNKKPSNCSDPGATLDQHNSYRTSHFAGPVAWEDTLAMYAQEWAAKVVETCEVAYDPNWEGGENVFITKAVAPAKLDEQCHPAVTWWYSEVAQYIYSDTPFTDNIVDNVVDFVQVVWIPTDEVGCGVAIKGNCKVVVCRYWVPISYNNEDWLNFVAPRST